MINYNLLKGLYFLLLIHKGTRKIWFVS